MKEVATESDFVFHKDPAPAQTARKAKAFLPTNVPYHRYPDMWPPSGPNCNLFEYYYCSVVDEDINAKLPIIEDIPGAFITKVVTKIDD